MDKHIIVSFKTVPAVEDEKNLQVSIESSDPADTMDDIIGLLHSTLQSLANSIENEK